MRTSTTRDRSTTTRSTSTTTRVAPRTPAPPSSCTSPTAGRRPAACPSTAPAWCRSCAGCVRTTTPTPPSGWARPGDRPAIPVAQGRKFVAALYRGVLGRAATSAELAARADALYNGADRRLRHLAGGALDGEVPTGGDPGLPARVAPQPGAGPLASRAATLAAGGRLDSLYIALAGSDEAWSRAHRDAATWVDQTCVCAHRSAVLATGAVDHPGPARRAGDHRPQAHRRPPGSPTASWTCCTGRWWAATPAPPPIGCTARRCAPAGCSTSRRRSRPAVSSGRDRSADRGPQPRTSRSRSPVARAAGVPIAARTCSGVPITLTRSRARVSPGVQQLPGEQRRVQGGQRHGDPDELAALAAVHRHRVHRLHRGQPARGEVDEPAVPRGTPPGASRPPPGPRLRYRR